MLEQKIQKKILGFQKAEITENHIYNKLSLLVKDAHNKELLKRIADDELKHYNFWKGHTKRDLGPDIFLIWKYLFISRFLGLTFGIKLMEKGEIGAEQAYEEISKIVPGAKAIQEDETKHEKQLINLIDEEKLKYIGSVVLGLNDALVELTGALAGFTFALQKPGLIATAGLVTGIAASLSMAASEYLSTKSEGGEKNPLKSSLYTGVAYVATVAFLVFPFFIFSNVFISLGITLMNALIVILCFTFYVSVAKDLPFKRRFLEMASISIGVAVLSFGIGYLIRRFLNIDI